VSNQTSFEVTFHLPNYSTEENVVIYSIDICGTETLTSNGPITIEYQVYGKGQENTKYDMSKVFVTKN
jgi:hypothetical protein